MARHRRHRRFNHKDVLFRLFRGLTGGSRALRRLFGFYPDLIVPASRMRELETTPYVAAMIGRPAHDKALMDLSQFNVDSMRLHETAPEWTSIRMARLISDVLIPGHRIGCVDPVSSCMIDLGGAWRTNWNHARPMLPLRQLRIEGVAIPFPRFSNYWHLIVDGLLPVLHTLKQLDLDPSLPITIVAPASGSQLLETILQGLCALSPRISLRRLRLFETARAEYAVYCKAHGRNKELTLAFPEALRHARKLFLDAYGPDPETTPIRLYIRRGPTRVRRVTGEDVLVDILRRQGFEILTPDWSNHREQFRLAARAQFIAGIHGAGLTNALWAPAGAVLCEIMAYDARKRGYLNTAAEMGLHYIPLFGGREYGRQEFAIDPDVIARDIIAAAHGEWAERS